MSAARLAPPDLPERAALAAELHARPPLPLQLPARASLLAVLVDAEARDAELAHLAKLARQFQLSPPVEGEQQWRVRLEPAALMLTWERHGEFSTLTLLRPGLAAEPFAETAAAALPEGWLAAWPGRTVQACHAELRTDFMTPTQVQQACFGGAALVGALVSDGAAHAFSDFRLHGDGFGRYVVIDRGLTDAQAGRLLQRLFEIETYRMMALLAFPLARRLSPRIQAIEQRLAQLADAMAAEGASDEPLLQQLTALAAEVESGLTASQFRFGACRAYAELVRTRISELREQRLPGLQTFEEFMARRFTPAVATSATASQRLLDLSERVAQASELLATRVGISRERQNHALLASMDRRAKLQLRLQQTVEGLSVAAIVYYAVGVLGYLVKGGAVLGLRWPPDLLIAAAVPIFLLLALLAVRRARRRARTEDVDA